MIEQLVEKRIMEKLDAALKAANVEGVEVVGAWQPSAAGTVKATESAALGYLTVKVNPREYDGYLTKGCALSCTVELDVRAESDANGASYLAITDALADVLFHWHDAVENVVADFSDIDGFDPVGFRLDGGEVGVDKTAAVWTYLHNFTLRGVITR